MCFISYTKSDKEWAIWIAWTLEKAGFRAVVQEWDFRPGQNFVLEMRHALKAADSVVAVLSPDYLQSGFASVEWAAAYAADPTGRTRKLIPVRVAACDPGDLLGQVIFVDLLELEELEAEAALIGAFAVRRKPAVAPPFPLHEGNRPLQPNFPGKAR